MVKTAFINPVSVVTSAPMAFNLKKPLSNIIFPVKFGYLYNYFAAISGSQIANSGWHVPTAAEFTALQNHLISNAYNYDGTTTGNKIAKALCSDSLWAYSSYIGAPGNPEYPNKANASGMNIPPGGRRSESGAFVYSGSQAYFWTRTEYINTRAYCRYIYNSSVAFNETNVYKQLGCYLRLVKDSTILASGEKGKYHGNDGKVYPTICIGGTEWLASNLAETLYRSGLEIPTVEGPSAWGDLTTGAKCLFNNDETNL